MKTITSADGTYARGDTLTISGTWPASIARLSVYAIGEAGSETVPMEVVSSSLDAEQKRYALELEEYVEALQDAA